LKIAAVSSEDEQAAYDGHDVNPREREVAHELGHLLRFAGTSVVRDDLLHQLGPRLERLDLTDVLSEQRSRALGRDDDGRVGPAAREQLKTDGIEHRRLADAGLASDEHDVLLLSQRTHRVRVTDDDAHLSASADHC